MNTQHNDKYVALMRAVFHGSSCVDSRTIDHSENDHVGITLAFKNKIDKLYAYDKNKTTEIPGNAKLKFEFKFKKTFPYIVIKRYVNNEEEFWFSIIETNEEKGTLTFRKSCSKCAQCVRSEVLAVNYEFDTSVQITPLGSLKNTKEIFNLQPEALNCTLNPYVCVATARNKYLVGTQFAFRENTNVNC